MRRVAGGVYDNSDTGYGFVWFSPPAEQRKRGRFPSFLAEAHGLQRVTDLSSHVFVSHDSRDKRKLVRPVIEALALSGVKLWLDRPGHGESHFDFDQDFIKKNRILSIRPGKDWDHEIMNALQQCGAILACFSRNFFSGGKVPVQELLAGQFRGNLVACIVDDLPFGEVPADLGLTDASKIQVLRISPTALRDAVDILRREGISGHLVRDLKREWEIACQLVATLQGIIEPSSGPTLPEISAARKVIAQVPIGPMVRAFEIPIEVIMTCANHLYDAPKIKAQVELSMRLVVECNAEDFALEQIVVRPGEMLTPANTTPVEFWSALLSVAGTKSRRTLAALLLAPGGPAHIRLGEKEKEVLRVFIEWLRSPSNSATNKA